MGIFNRYGCKLMKVSARLINLTILPLLFFAAAAFDQTAVQEKEMPGDGSGEYVVE